MKHVLELQKVIYGVDDRQDLYEVTTQALKDDADSVVALFKSSSINDNGDGTSTLATKIYGDAYKLCGSEPFRNQPIGAFCSGVLVAADLVATAGHCVNAQNVTNVKFVFGFRMKSASEATTVISNGEIYTGKELLGREEEGTGPDWSLVRLDRPVTGHKIAKIRRDGKIGDQQSVHVIGHPCGLPAKFAGGAAVRDNTKDAVFVANLDTYGGNSGSPVFNSDSHTVEGLLVRGENDFVAQGACQVSVVCPTTGCRGEDCTRTTVFADKLPAQP